MNIAPAKPATKSYDDLNAESLGSETTDNSTAFQVSPTKPEGRGNNSPISC